MVRLRLGTKGRVGPPPVHAHLYGFVHRADHQPDLDGQEFHFHQADLNVPGNDDALSKILSSRSARVVLSTECCMVLALAILASLKELAQGTQVDIQVLLFQPELLPESVDLLGLFHQG